jgi:hypothetical protein
LDTVSAAVSPVEPVIGEYSTTAATYEYVGEEGVDL